MTDLQEIMGRVIRRERQDRQLTIKELGEKAGLSEIYVGEIERGQKYPSAKVLESIASALDLDLADLLELMADEIRGERQPEAVEAIGFTLPSTPGQPRRLVVKKIRSSTCSTRGTWKVLPTSALSCSPSTWKPVKPLSSLAHAA